MEKKELQVKMMVYIMAKSLEEIAKVDKELKEEFEELDGIIQWNIGNIRAYLKFKDGNYSFVMDEEAENPDVKMILEDIELAEKFFRGELDRISAFMSGELKIEGDLQLTMYYGSLIKYIEDYLEPILPT